MRILLEFADALSGRWEGEPPRPAILLIADIILAAMLLATILLWAGGGLFIYQGI